MKKLLFAGLLLVAFSTAMFAREVVATGKSHTTMGDYTISLADKPLIINGEELRAFVISYQNSPLEVTVAIKEGKKCNDYIVLSDKLSVQYTCNKDYFGVQKLDKSIECEGFSTSENLLNRNEYFHQKKLTDGQNSELENTQMIAAYFPMLINEEVVAEK
jgi:hypothetical protein